ncbi:MAG: hypothetical protein AAFP19_10380 [Bacteroidota bacterium]
MLNNQVFNWSLFILFCALVPISCVRESSDSVDQDKIYVEHELFYNANEDKTYARATFRFSNITGTKLELADPSTISFNGDALSWQGVLAYYENDYAGFVDSGTFSWTDTEGNSFSNTISINPIAYPSLPDTLRRDGAFDLIWDGAPLGARENVTVTVNGKNEGDLQIFFTDQTNANNIILDKDKLEQLGQGEGTIFMDRRLLPEVGEATSAGAILTGRYRPENAVIIVE